MQIMCQRIQMAGMECRAYAYEVYVPLESLPESIRTRQTYMSDIDGRLYVDFTAATLPESHYSLPVGPERYGRYQDHERAARAKAWRIIREVFPETQGLDADSLPWLWISFPGPQTLESQKVEFTVS